MRYPGLRAQVAGVAMGVLVLALLPGAPGNTAARAAVRGQAEQRDADGRVVRSPTGKRFTYPTSPKVPRSRLSRARAARAAVATGARYVSTEPDAPSLTLEWNRAALGVGIGLTGLFAADVDADGTVEIVAGGGGGGFGPNQRWYVLSRRGAGYDQEFASLPYPSGVGAVRVAQMDADAPLEVVVGSGTSVFVYDGASHALERTLTLPSGAFAISTLAVADVDADGALEVVATDGTDVFILNAATGALEWRGTGVGGVDLAVGQIDADAGLEIVVANGASTGHVIDGKTHVGQWSTAFGRHVSRRRSRRRRSRRSRGRIRLVGPHRLRGRHPRGPLHRPYTSTSPRWGRPTSTATARWSSSTATASGAACTCSTGRPAPRCGRCPTPSTASPTSRWETSTATACARSSGEPASPPRARTASTSRTALTHAIEWQSLDISGPFYGLDYR